MTARADVTIVAGGWSVANIPLDRLAGVVIAVNDAAVHLETWHHAVSMDRKWTEARLQRVWIKSMEDSPFGEIWIRRNALQNFAPGAVAAQHNLTPFECDHLTNDFTRELYRRSDGAACLNGMNSGACALNLAWHLRPRRLFLCGFDMNRGPNGQAYWYQPYNWSTPAGGTSASKYARWAKQFEQARRDFGAIDCDVFNVSPSSAIAAFRKITPLEYLRLTR